MTKPMTVLEWERLPADGKEYPDRGVARLYHTSRKGGKRSACVRYRFEGRPRKLTIPCSGMNAGEMMRYVRDKAREANCIIADGGDPAAAKQAARAAAKAVSAIPANDLVEAIAARFVSHYAKRQLKADTARQVERMLNKEIDGPWRGRRLSQIGKADIHQLLDDIVERGSPVTANRTLAWLHRMCSWAVERGLITSNPCTGIKAPAAEMARDRVLSDEELKAVWQAAEGLGQPYEAFIKLLILLGPRRTEAAEMTWREADLDSRLWTLPKERSKNGREHTVPLPDSAVAILRSLPRIAGSDLVFSLNGRNRITGFHLIKQRIDALMPPNISPWTFHDLRRTFASGCARLGIAVHVVEAALNHRSGTIKGVAAVYNRYSYDAEKRAAMTAWARYVDAIVTGKAAGNVVELASSRA